MHTATHEPKKLGRVERSLLTSNSTAQSNLKCFKIDSSESGVAVPSRSMLEWEWKERRLWRKPDTIALDLSEEGVETEPCTHELGALLEFYPAGLISGWQQCESPAVAGTPEWLAMRLPAEVTILNDERPKTDPCRELIVQKEVSDPVVPIPTYTKSGK